MIIDSSALLAILFDEPGAEEIILSLKQARLRRIAAPTLLEASMAATRILGPEGCDAIKKLVKLANIEIIAFDDKMAWFSIDAFLKFGKGRGHPSQLNFGDCIAYAVSKVEGLPLLFKGEDFSKTDVERVL